MTRPLSQGYKANRLSNTFKKFYADTLMKLDNTRKMSVKCLLKFKIIFFLFFPGFVKAELIKLAEMAGVMHEIDHAYSIRSTW